MHSTAYDLDRNYILLLLLDVVVGGRCVKLIDQLYAFMLRNSPFNQNYIIIFYNVVSI